MDELFTRRGLFTREHTTGCIKQHEEGRDHEGCLCRCHWGTDAEAERDAAEARRIAHWVGGEEPK